VDQLSLADERDVERRRRSPEETESDPLKPSETRKRKRQPAPEVGQALRSAYQRTLDETVPPEMLDLLGKLG
jgi:hypothetical protein